MPPKLSILAYVRLVLGGKLLQAGAESVQLGGEVRELEVRYLRPFRCKLLLQRISR